MSAEDPTSHIVQSLLINMAIAVGKGVAAFLTGSGAMLAETIHSASDCANQLLLLLGVNRARKAPDEKHPLGYGRVLYFWSFVVALLLFTGGGVFAIYEGIHKIKHPEPMEQVWVGVAILVGSILLEGGATISNMRELNRRRGEVGFFRFLRETKDSDLVVVFGENSAATMGLTVALGALLLSFVTGDGRWDGFGSLAIGIILVGVAIFLAVEIQSLLVGEAADPAVEREVRALAAEQTHFADILEVITVQQGPGQVMVAVKVRMNGDITADEVVDSINAFEVKLKEKRPEVQWSFIEPDLPNTPVRETTKSMKKHVRAIGAATPGVETITQLLAMDTGPTAMLLALKVRFSPNIRVEEVEAITDNLERRIRDELPMMRRIFVEADGDFDATRSQDID